MASSKEAGTDRQAVEYGDRQVARGSDGEIHQVAAEDAAGRWATAVRHPFPRALRALYTAEYRPAEGAVRYHWPDRTWAQSLDAFDPDSIQIRLGAP